MGLGIGAIVSIISATVAVGTTIYAMTQMPDKQEQDAGGSKITKNGTSSPRNRVYGKAIVGCTSVYSNVLNKSHNVRLDVFAVGGAGAVTFHNIWIDDSKMFEEDKADFTPANDGRACIYTSNDMRGRYKSYGGFQMQWRSGQENQVASQLAIDNSDGEWTVNHRGSFVPHIVIRANYVEKTDAVILGSRYNITALVTGADVYDPRTGLVNGESSNTALAVLDFLTNTYYGMGIPTDYIDIESFKYAATFVDNHDLRINSAINADDSYADILRDMLACCGGALAITNGRIKFLVEEAVTAPIYEFDEDNITKGTLKVSPSGSSDYYNVVTTQFKSASNRDNADDFMIPADTTTDPRIRQDGQVITKSLKMPYARDAYPEEEGKVLHGVKHMTNIVYKKAFFQTKASFEVDLYHYPLLEPFSVVAITSSVYGYSRKLFRVESMKISTTEDRFNMAVINCVEYDHSIYDSNIDGVINPPRPELDDSIGKPTGLSFQLIDFVSSGKGSLSWQAGYFTPSTAYDIEYKLSTASEWTRLTTAFRGLSYEVSNLKQASYDFRVRTYELVLGHSEWTTITNQAVKPTYVIPAVTGLVIDATGLEHRFTWDNMKTVKIEGIPANYPNTNGGSGLVSDVFKQYAIEILVGGTRKHTVTTQDNYYTFSKRDIENIVTGRSYTVRIRVEDVRGKAGAWKQLTVNNAQCAIPSDIDVTAKVGIATIEWSPCLDDDFVGSEIHVSKDAEFTPSESTLYATLGKESFYVFNFPDTSDYYIRVGHFDSHGKDGIKYSLPVHVTYEALPVSKVVRLVSESTSFHVDKNGTVTPSQIVLTATTQNTEGAVSWSVSPSVTLTAGSNPNEKIIKAAALANHEQVKVTINCEGQSDTITVFKVRDGQDGHDGQDGQNGQDGSTIYEQYRYGQTVTVDSKWTAWGADMRDTDMFRQRRVVTNGVAGAAGSVHRIKANDGTDGADGDRVFIKYHTAPLSQRPNRPEGDGNNGGWVDNAEGANWMTQKVAKTIDEPLTFWSFPIQMKGNDGEVDYSQVDEIAEAKKNEAIEASIASAQAQVEAAEVRAKAYADGVATEAEQAAILAADAKANAAETKAKAYADGVVTEAEAAAIAEAERLAAQAEANAKAASDPKGSASKAQQAAIAAAEEKANAAKVFAQSYADGVATEAEQAAIAAAEAKAKAAEVAAKAYADGQVTEAEQAAIAEAERLASEAEERAKAAAIAESKDYSNAQVEAVRDVIEQIDLRALALPEDTNLLNVSTWKVGTQGSQVGFNRNGRLEESAIVSGMSPFGADALWECRPYGDSSGDGGWVTSEFPIDTTKTYRFCVWFKVKDAKGAGAFYLGCSQSGSTANLNGTVNKNPYFVSGNYRSLGKVEADKWYLAVGVVHPHTYTGSDSGVAGIYDPVTGEKLYDGTEFKAVEGKATQAHRCYLYYTDNNTQRQWMVRPRVEVLDGTEVSLEKMFSTAVAGAQSLHAVKEAAEAAAKAAEVEAKAYADGVATEAEQAAITAAQAAANAAEVKAKAYADGEVTKAEQAAIDEAERLAAQAEANAKALAQGVGAYREVTFGFSPTEGGSYHSLSGLQYYTVSETVLLKSCVVNASKEGTVTICLYKGHGKATDKLVAQKEVTLTKGVQRIELGFVFDKAVSTTWTLMRKGDVPLYRHIGANTVTYPREAGSLVTPQSSAGSDMAYYYFYNLEVAGLGVEGTPIGADAVGSAAAAKEAAEAYALAKANLAETKAKAYADGVVTEAEQAAIDEAERLAAAAQENAKIAAEESTGRWSRDYMVNATKFAEVLDIKGASLPTQIGGTAGYSRYLVTLTTLGTGTRTEYAAWLRFDSAKWVVTTIKASGTSSNHPVLFIQDNKPYIKTYHEKEYRVRCTVEDQYVSAASAISQSAKEYADATANAAEVKAKAYADGIVTESEQAAIEAAEAAANAAEVRAKAYADGEVTKAEQAAIAAAQEAANLAETKAKAYADGVSTEAELAAIAAAEAKAKAAEVAAKAYADGEVTKAEQAAIEEAERLADEAKAHADAELKKERKRQFDPHLTDPLKTFSKVASGSPDVISTLEGVGNISVVSGVTGGNALSLTGDHWIYSTAVIPVDTSKKYKMVVKVRQTKDKTAGGSGFYAGVVTLDRNYNNLTGGEGTHRYFCAKSETLTVAGGWRTFEGYIQGVGDAHNNFRAGTAYVRPMFIVNYSKGNGIAEVDEIRFYEVTAQGDLIDLGFETAQGAQDKANAAQAAAEAYAKARAEAALNTQFVHSGFIERDGLNFRKKSGVSQWDGWASSKQTFTGGCSLTFTAGTTNAAAMCGITTPNMGGASYTDIDFCFYIRSNGTLAIYENGKHIADYGNYTVGTVLTIRYDGIRVRYFVNGVLKREVGTSANLGFVADMSIYDVSTGFPIQGLTFLDSEGAVAWAKDNLDNRIPQANADALKTMMANEGLRYYKKITVGGEANKYYPVIIHGGDQNKLRTIKIWRSYSETAPNSWNTATHKGALMMTWQGNFGGWGGAVYRSTLLEHSEAYSDILADCYIVNHSMGFAFFLRGGTAVYHIASDMDISGVERTNPSGGGSGIYLDGTLNSYVHATLPYNAPDALTTVNRDRLTSIKTAYNGQGQYIKNLNADNISTGTLSAQRIEADVYNGTLVNATNIKAGMLDANHINTRTFSGENAIFDAEVYGGVLTGAVVRTGSTGARAEMREDGYKFAAYNAQNKPTFYVDANGNVVMNSGSISSDVLSEASRNSNIVTWIGTAGKGGNMQFTDNLVLQNDVTYFPITNNFYTTGKNGVLNVQFCAANGYLFQDEKSAVGAAAPAQKTLPANAAPTVYFVDASNTTKGSVMRMTITYTTQAANGTAASKSNPSGTQGWRKTYAHFHIDNVATRPNVATGTNVKGYKLCINLGASSIKDKLKALKRVPDVINYHETAEGGRYLPHSYKVVWSGNAAAVTNSWGEGLYYIIGTQRSDWRNCGFVMVAGENHHAPQHRSIYGQYDAYYEYRYDTKQFKASKTHIAVIIKLSGV
ncbi:fibronectin type III domain-containing protein [Vibrio parahaemolyticus]